MALVDPDGADPDLNEGLPTLQFQNLAVDLTDPRDDLQGGTQDNGTPGMKNGYWSMNVHGDGGPASIDVNGTTRMHTYTGPYFDVNFEGNVEDKWLWNSDPLIFANLLFGEGAGFYSPLDLRSGRLEDDADRPPARLADEAGRRRPRLPRGELQHEHRHAALQRPVRRLGAARRADRLRR